jgi:hypothetical protein
MTAAFDCPQCGAPLSFDPHPGDETIECPYCHETVIIPKDMRIPLPKPVVQAAPPPRAQSKSRNWVAVAVVGMVVLGMVVSILFSGNNSDQSSSDTSGSGSSDATTAPLSVVDRATATVEAQATLDSLQPVLAQEQIWPATFTDKFTDNSHDWQTGDIRDSYLNGNRSISGGIYSWKLTTVQSTSDFSFPNMPDQTDFFASVDMNLVSMPDDADADAGLVFRYNSTDQTWYYFSVNNQGQYYFGYYDGSSWNTLIAETDSAAIQVGQTNTLAVGAQGSQFIFLVNGQVVDHFINDRLPSGTVGVGINLPGVGEKANVEFSNFVVSSAASP